jgi:hypothetical protein
MLEMNQTEYARHRGVTKQAVAWLVKAGKIELITKPDGSKVIDAAAADLALGETRERIVTRDDEATDAAPAAPTSPPEGGGLTKAKTATEVYRARLAQLEYEERIGHLLKTDDVTRSAELCGEAIVRDIDRLSTYAEDVAVAFGRGGVPAVRTLLKEIARSLRVTIGANMRLLAADGTLPQEKTSSD